MTQKITILNLCINLEKLGRNLNFTVEYKIGNLHREKLCLNLSFTVESKIGNLRKTMQLTFQTLHNE